MGGPGSKWRDPAREVVQGEVAPGPGAAQGGAPAVAVGVGGNQPEGGHAGHGEDESGHWCHNCRRVAPFVIPRHNAPCALEDAGRQPEDQGLLAHPNTMVGWCGGKRGGLFEEGEEGQHRRARSAPLLKGWEEMRGMAAGIGEEATHAMLCLSQITEHLGAVGHGEGPRTAAAFLEQARARGRLCQLGCILPGAGAHLVGVAQQKEHDNFCDMHANMSYELREELPDQHCPICGNLGGGVVGEDDDSL